MKKYLIEALWWLDSQWLAKYFDLNANPFKRPPLFYKACMINEGNACCWYIRCCVSKRFWIVLWLWNIVWRANFFFVTKGRSPYQPNPDCFSLAYVRGGKLSSSYSCWGKQTQQQICTFSLLINGVYYSCILPCYIIIISSKLLPNQA
jgi:hypothetical protein